MAKKLVINYVEKSTGDIRSVVIPLKGSKHHMHLVKAFKKATKGIRVISFTISG